MLEEQGILADKIRERDEIVSGELFPLVSENKRRELLESLERDIAAKTKEIDGLIVVVGDPESVADANGWLPCERRELALSVFKARRGTEVRDLRARIADGEATLKSQKGRSERADLQGPPQAPPPPPPQPIAVLAPGMPIEDVIAQLTAIQADHPGAQVRQGRGNRWEIWPARTEPESPGH
jgi:hypothetical protein